jgi:6-phosphogluconolactonase
MAANRQVEVLADASALTRAAAGVFVDAARRAVASSGRFTVALSGGNTPKALYSLLVTDSELRSQVPWQQVYFFFSDERHVPPDHADSNYRSAHDAMFSNLDLEPGHVFRIKGEAADASQAAAQYEQDLRTFFSLSGPQLPRFDLIMLGMGPDGHTASLFPGTKALDEEKRLVAANWIEKFHSYRITMTAPVLNNAASVLFLAHGADKAAALKAVLEGSSEPKLFPSQLVQPRDGTVLWLVDESAAALLNRQLHSTRG